MRSLMSLMASWVAETFRKTRHGCKDLGGVEDIVLIDVLQYCKRRVVAVVVRNQALVADVCPWATLLPISRSTRACCSRPETSGSELNNHVRRLIGIGELARRAITGHDALGFLYNSGNELVVDGGVAADFLDRRAHRCPAVMVLP